MRALTILWRPEDNVGWSLKGMEGGGICRSSLADASGVHILLCGAGRDR